jgi:biotin-(acetyl-CoA carboxylase) ligase
VSGIAMGVNDSGALLLRADGRVQSFFSGSVTRL